MSANVNMKMQDGNWFLRVIDHAAIGLSRDVIIKDYKHDANILEKTGNGILWTVGNLPRAVKWIGKQFNDPRVVTVLLTITALALTTFAFYPAITTAAVAAACTAIKAALMEIPFWAVKFAGYVLTCGVIVGYGARAAGRFGNEELMKAFYGLPNYNGNPAGLSIEEIMQARNAQAAAKSESASGSGGGSPSAVQS